ncbi:MAG: DUF1080 domain-containing protein [Verrucomicrobiaceae bacterium]|nr:MAG: DUF1080 domain-containing protein [Verrucomicrobiaceae bacterium]
MKRRQFLPAVPLLFGSAALVSGSMAGEKENKPGSPVEEAKPGAEEAGFVPLFPEDGPPKGFRLGAWDDVSKPAPEGAVFTVKDGVLHGPTVRGCWLLSEKEYGDFVLAYEFKLGPRGNSGCALRAPLKGDPAFDGLEMQMADVRYNPEAKPSELTGGFYRAAAPSSQVYKPEDWNQARIELRGSKAKVEINGVTVQDIDFDTFTETVLRHDGTMATSLKERPRKGHIGFQELSRGGGILLLRNARIRELK